MHEVREAYKTTDVFLMVEATYKQIFSVQFFLPVPAPPPPRHMVA